MQYGQLTMKFTFLKLPDRMSPYDFLVDVNLPKHFSFFNAPNFQFVIDSDGKADDRDICNATARPDIMSGRLRPKVSSTRWRRL